ncbi:MAG: thioredoxin family protein [Vicinamibacteria bacterium]|jgi:thioredoxin-like negative regulator of GroEL|nr:thioredoxin family protein [Vicinamibacteria bacterium]
MKRLFLSLVWLGLTALPGWAAENNGIAWELSFEAAQKKSKATGKPILVDFWAEWCGWCHQLDRTTYQDPEVVALSRDFIAVKVDTEGDQRDIDVAMRFEVSSLPTIMFLTPAGKVVARINGYQSPRQFVDVLRDARQTSVSLLGWEKALAANPQDPNALLNLGFLALEQERVEEGLDMLARAKAQEQKLPVNDRKRLYLALGVFKRAERKWAEAEALLKGGMQLAPPNADLDAQLQYALARAYATQGKTVEARMSLQQIVKSYPKSPVASRARAMLAYLEGE